MRAEIGGRRLVEAVVVAVVVGVAALLLGRSAGSAVFFGACFALGWLLGSRLFGGRREAPRPARRRPRP